MDILKIITIVILLIFVNIVNSQYSANWTELNKRPNPAWYDEVKFGIFIHFGIYSVPAFNNGSYAEWYWWNLETGNFAPMFNLRDFDANDWAQTIEKSGAKYVVLTSKHHEGYTLWQSNQSWNWNSVDNGPGIDIVGELTKAVKNLGMHMGLYHSLYEWYNPLYNSDKDSGNPPKKDVYVQQVLMPMLMDLVNTYEPHIIWADGEWEQTSSYWKSTEFLSWLYSDSPVKDQVVVNDRWGSECRGVDGGFFTGNDHWQPGHLVSHKWENCETFDNSYGYNQFQPAKAYSNSTELIREFVETVACGGNFLLDIGPDSEGVIPINEQNNLLDMGFWLQINGEAIYGSSPWRVQNQTESIWFTTNTTNGNVYAFVYEYPETGQIVLKDPQCKSSSVVTLLGFKSSAKITTQLPKNDQPGITLNLPFAAPQDYPPFVYVFKFTGCE
ncbi:hypothetical protein DICPUDRAFT_58554 [Dictyostelium purpureum]|uniref:alpha-L-fucosidase n=1 Tax=Dictyostelium purpureum TaxID=5786 RepID=F1A1M6_DICPU|nr:uncharacterized protein DICPUDRAFT_58554 [Dictyostelium purpureum]EGC29909.1 hypothetical protein DICPUDRAFT_58554 [Dictyostelium purpureum]|eukprot:XP_003293570.1 hypothetical protein DICPUDRAFT_58554 [Dictyostelium purpureum]